MTRFGRIAIGVFAAIAIGVVGADTREVPRPAKQDWIDASIEAVRKNGVAERLSREFGEDRTDGSRALPIRHVVRCATETACEDVARWARRAGLTPAPVRTEFGHGSVPHWHVVLREKLPLETGRIRAAALAIHDALERFSDARYDTWMLDLDPHGVSDAR